jgi:DNA-binding NarL/FixJ family response regulator
MTRVIVVADGGPALETVTRALAPLGDVEVVRHLSGRAPVAPLVERLDPDLVFIDELRWSGLTLSLVGKVRRAAPAAAIVVRAADPEADWLARALQAGAAAVLPAVADTATLGLVLHEVIAASPAFPVSIDQPLAA